MWFLYVDIIDILHFSMFNSNPPSFPFATTPAEASRNAMRNSWRPRSPAWIHPNAPRCRGDTVESTKGWVISAMNRRG